MKKNFLLILFLVSLLPVSAKERSKQEMLQIAAQIIHQKSTRSQTVPLAILYETDMLSVIGAERGGFAVVASDDAFSPIVGYGDGLFIPQDGNSLSWFIEEVSLSMKGQLAAGKIPHTPQMVDASKFKPAQEPLLTSTWNQNSPFNDLCPKSSDRGDYPSGCVATALSQIMYYHKYPETGKGQKQYSFKPASGVGELLSANFEETTYDWDHMIDDYVKGHYTEEEGIAVATLMFHCGVAVEMNYTPSGSGAYSSEARSGLINHFRYHPHIGILHRNYYSQEEWMNIVYTELNEERPIYYAGSDKNQGGHAFVIDGYDESGLVHVNWGWGTTGGNGYFDIALLNPRGYEFSSGQEMLVGIARPEANITYESHLVSDAPMSVGKIGSMLNVSPGTSIWNLNGDGWEGLLGVVLKGKGQTYVLASKEVKKTANRYNVLLKIDGTLGGLQKLPVGIEDGEYRLFIGSKDEYDTDWSLVRRSEGNANSYLLTIENGTLTNLTADSSDTWPRTITAVHTISSNQNVQKRRQIYDLNGRFVGWNKNSLPKGIYIINGEKVVIR